nr:MAG: RNA-dependent RNA polymerase [Mitovirus sp.]
MPNARDLVCRQADEGEGTKRATLWKQRILFLGHRWCKRREGSVETKWVTNGILQRSYRLRSGAPAAQLSKVGNRRWTRQINVIIKMLFKLLKIENLRVSAKLAHWRPDLKVWRHLMEPMISWARLVSGRPTRSKIIQLATFAKWVANMVRKQGVPGLVQYLKTAHTMLMQGVPGSELKVNSRAISKVAVAVGGSSLPRVIPSYARAFIRRGDESTIRFWLTLLGMYRILLIEPKYKFGTITDPGVTLNRVFLQEWCRFIRSRFIPDVEVHTGEKLLDVGTDVLGRPSVLPLMKASADLPNVDWEKGEVGPSTSFGCRFNSARHWTEGKWGWSLFRYLSVTPGGTGTTKSLWTLMTEVAEAAPVARQMTLSSAVLERIRSQIKVFKADGDVSQKEITLRKRREYPNGSSKNGRLSVKIEPAGKARVFAMVDYWTQVALKPLHEWIFSVLREIPQDGTFDQMKPVKRLLKVVSFDQKIYSFDLSAATDRLPVLLQGLLTHHAMVQFAAYRAGEAKWFDRYAVLGDDIVIADDRVAREYRKFCDMVGLGIGIAKSLEARGKTLEFAKKFFFRGELVSGLPVKFWAAAQHSAGVAHALSVWYPAGSLANFVRALGVGFKGASKVDARWELIPRRLKVLLVLLTQPATGGRFAMPTWLDWLTSHSAIVKANFDDSLSRLISFNAWATGLITEVLTPARDRVDSMQSDIFFAEEGSWDPCGRLIDAESNKASVSALKSIDLAEESMKHLQRLNLRFNPVQTSAIFAQVVRSAEKVDLISPSAARALKRSKEVEVAKVLEFFRLWTRLRLRMGVGVKAWVPLDEREGGTSS